MACHVEGSGASSRMAISLTNDSTESITVLGMNVPWNYHHATHFSAPGYTDPILLADPGDYETLILLPGDTAGGEVPLPDRLVDSFGRSVTEIPGEHEIEVSARLELDPDTPRRRRMDARCTTTLTVDAATGP
jgi:hypothetical protein